MRWSRVDPAPASASTISGWTGEARIAAVGTAGGATGSPGGRSPGWWPRSAGREAPRPPRSRRSRRAAARPAASARAWWSRTSPVATRVTLWGGAAATGRRDDRVRSSGPQAVNEQPAAEASDGSAPSRGTLEEDGVPAVTRRGCDVGVDAQAVLRRPRDPRTASPTRVAADPAPLVAVAGSSSEVGAGIVGRAALRDLSAAARSTAAGRPGAPAPTRRAVGAARGGRAARRPRTAIVVGARPLVERGEHRRVLGPYRAPSSSRPPSRPGPRRDRPARHRQPTGPCRRGTSPGNPEPFDPSDDALGSATRANGPVGVRAPGRRGVHLSDDAGPGACSGAHGRRPPDPVGRTEAVSGGGSDQGSAGNGSRPSSAARVAARQRAWTWAGTSTRGYRSDMVKQEGRRRAPQTGVALLAEYQGGSPPRTPTACSSCLQALDAAGKDGTIRHVMSGVNPRACGHSFKVPSAEELDHDFLGATPSSCPPGADRHLQPVALRGGPRGARPPELLARQQLPRGARRRDLEAPLPRDQRLGALPRRQRLPHREAVPQPLEGGAARRFLARIDGRRRTGSSRPTTPRTPAWDDYQDAFSGMLSHTSTSAPRGT